MTAGIRAPDATSGALTVNGLDRLLLNADATLSAVADPPTGARNKQLATMQKFADEFGAVLGPLATSAGYQKLPSGLIIQWGTALVPANNTPLDVSLAMTFPNQGMRVFATIFGSGFNNAVLGGTVQSNSQIRLWNSSNGGSQNSSYLVLGY